VTIFVFNQEKKIILTVQSKKSMEAILQYMF